MNNEVGTGMDFELDAAQRAWLTEVREFLDENVTPELRAELALHDLEFPDGEVVEVNEELDDDPGLINAEPYGLGWMFRVRIANGQTAGADLLSPTEYDALTKSAG